MDGDNVSVLGRILQAARERRHNAARDYMLALTSSVAVGECADEIKHDHMQFYLRGLDLLAGPVSV